MDPQRVRGARAHCERRHRFAMLLLLPLTLQPGDRLWSQEQKTAPIIYAVFFAGQKNISSKTLRRVAGLKPGDKWSDAVAAEVHSRLRQWPYLSTVTRPRVTSRPNGQVVVFITVTESPIIGEVAFSSNDAISTTNLKKALRLKAGDPFGPETVARAVDTLIRHYHRDGFLLAVVEGDVRPRQDRRDVTFTIREGQRIHVSAITILGAEQISEGEALKHLRNQPRRFFGLVSKGYYRPGLVEAGLESLQLFYLSRGFTDVEVGMDELRFNQSRTAVELVLRVHEGRRWTFAGVRIEGNELLPTALLEKVIDLPPGGYYDRDTVDSGRKRLSEFYQKQTGLLPQITLSPELYFQEARLKVVFKVAERPHIVVEEVRITGNKNTRDRVVRQDITLMPGGLFTTTELRRSLARIRERGIFQREEVIVHDGSTPGGKIVEFAVTERDKPGILEVGGGASTGSGEIAFARVVHTNLDLFRLPRSFTDWEGAFVGGGQTLELELMPGRIESYYRLRFEEPYFFKKDLAFSVFGAGRILSRRSYDENHIAVEARLRQFLDEDRNLSLSLSYIADRVEIDRLSANAPPAVFEDRGTTLLAYPRLALSWDETKFNFFSGPTGFFAAARIDLADGLTGSELDFFRSELRADYFLALFDRDADFAHKLHLNLRFRWMEGRGGNDTHIAERFYLGGPQSFRGFAYRRLGPHQRGTPVGGEALIAGTVKYSFPLILREIRGMAIFDWGDLEPTISRLSTSRMRTAAGGGLQIRFPAFGMLDLYWVQALAKGSEDRAQLFGLTLGVEF